MGRQGSVTRLNLGAGHYGIDGFINLDPVRDPPWRFQDGLPFHEDGSVEGITVSCALCYLPFADWPPAFQEFARVLERGGVIRVQDEWADHPQSAYYPEGFPGVATLTTPDLVWEAMRAARLAPTIVSATTTTFRDRSLIQNLHRGEPHTFAVEGVK